MFCTKCGTQLNDNAVFCTNCGNKVGATAAETTATTNEATTTTTEVPTPAPTPVEDPAKAKKENLLTKILTWGKRLAIAGGAAFLATVILNLLIDGDVFFTNDITSITLPVSLILMIVAILAIVGAAIAKKVSKISPIFGDKKARNTIVILLIVCILFTAFGLVIADENSYTPSTGSSGSYMTLSSAYYANNCQPPYASFGGSYISIDTNPYNIDSDESGATTYSSQACAAIRGINSSLGFPSYVYQDMIATRALDGRQSYTGTRFSASWRYHPDSGLEVMYTEN